MSRRVLMGFFESEKDILGITSESRRQGYSIVDVFTPYAVHGLDRAMGLKPSKLPWICFLLGLVGAAFKVWFEFWTTASDWAIDVGGKPWDSLPAFVPVTFEVMVLFAGVSTVVAFLATRRLLPGRKAVMPDLRVTDDHFVIVLEETDAAFDPATVKDLFYKFNAVNVEEREDDVP